MRPPPVTNVHLSVTYRPLRIAWCVKDGCLDDLRQALRLTHCFWGGVFNPVVPVEGNTADERLVWLYKTDALYCASDDSQTEQFSKSIANLSWPGDIDGLFMESRGQMEPQLLDLFQAILKTEEYGRKNWLGQDFSPAVVEWEPDDPLGDVLLATFGSFPDPARVGCDYNATIEDRLSAERVSLSPSEPIPADLPNRFGVAALARLDLHTNGFDWNRRPGVFLGGVENFADLAHFWNLRAADYPLLFFDPSHAERLAPMVKAWADQSRSAPKRPNAPDTVPLWTSREVDSESIKEQLGGGFGLHVLGNETWNGLNVKPGQMTFETETTVAPLVREFDTPTVTITLPPKPFVVTRPSVVRQHIVVSVSSTSGLNRQGVTVAPPFVPALNEFYGRELYFLWTNVRAEPGSVGIVINTSRDHLTLSALDHERVVVELFEKCGFTATPSDAGRVARRLVVQMGGLQGCRVFKIPGVRNLIAKYSPEQSFTQSRATQLIGDLDPNTGKPRLGYFEHLHLRGQKGRRLRPTDAFLNLIRQEVLMAGLKLRCPHCELDSWRAIDDLGTRMNCLFCGNSLGVTEQLSDRDWFYRRSGLFGRRDDQRGALPVTLVLQALDMNFLERLLCYSTSLDLTAKGDRNRFCETDFVAVLRQMNKDRDAVLVGECKTAGEIEEDDAVKLSTVADALSKIGVDPFVVFAKTTPFSDEEIERCKKAQAPFKERVILLPGEELENLRFFDRRKDVPDRLRHVHDALGLAKATTHLYFQGAYRTQDGWEKR